MDCIVYGITKSRTGLSDFHFHSKNLADQIAIRVGLNWVEQCHLLATDKVCIPPYTKVHRGFYHTNTAVQGSDVSRV